MKLETISNALFSLLDMDTTYFELKNMREPLKTLLTIDSTQSIAASRQKTEGGCAPWPVLLDN